MATITLLVTLYSFIHFTLCNVSLPEIILCMYLFAVFPTRLFPRYNLNYMTTRTLSCSPLLHSSTQDSA